MDTTFQAVCFTADVMDSRRNGKEEELGNIALLLNEKYRDHCITPFTQRAGDELFGVVSNFADAYRVLKDFFRLSEKNAIPLYVGVGLGTINGKNFNDPNVVNGHAIWNSADALKFMKNNDSQVKSFRNDAGTFKYFVYADEHEIPYKLLNYMVAFLFEKIAKRTAKQADVIEVMERFPELSLEAVGNKVGYEKNASTNISKLLYRAEHQVVHGAENELMNFLNQIQHGRRG